MLPAAAAGARASAAPGAGSAPTHKLLSINLDGAGTFLLLLA
jgi:hypothetical protein